MHLKVQQGHGERGKLTARTRCEQSAVKTPRQVKATAFLDAEVPLKVITKSNG